VHAHIRATLADMYDQVQFLRERERERERERGAERESVCVREREKERDDTCTTRYYS
jgi:hypothetical protein